MNTNIHMQCNDAGAGEQFVCTTLLPEHAKPAQIPVDKKGHVDFSKDFFGRRCCLTVSGCVRMSSCC